MKNLFKNLSLILISVFVALLLLEFCLRWLGHTPFKYLKSNSPHKSIYKIDKKLGWTNKTGNHLLQIDDKNYVSYKILEDGSRYTGHDLKKNIAKNKIILVGGSFALGQAINDEETFAFYLQKNLD